MSKQDMIKLIKAAESANNLNNMIIMLTSGYPIDNEGYSKIFLVYEVLFNNSKYAGREDDESYEEFRAILNAMNLTPEEKYDLIKQN